MAQRPKRLSRDPLLNKILQRQQAVRTVVAAKPVEETPPEVLRARQDPVAFNAFVLRDEETNLPIVMAPHHVEWQRLLNDPEPLVIIGALETGKSQQVSIGRVLFELGRDPNTRVVMLGNAEGLAKKLADPLRRYIERSDELHQVFPHLMRGQPWTDTHFNVARQTYAKDFSVQVLGVDGTPQGSRIDILVVDDVLDINNTATAARRLDTIRRVKQVMARAKRRKWFLGNAWHREDLLEHLEKLEGFRGRVKRYPVVARDPVTKELVSLWPERWTMERIRQQQNDLGPLEFARLMMCEPRDDASQRFQAAWLDGAKAQGDGKTVAYRLAALPIGYRTFTGCDLAAHKGKGAARTALVTIIVHPSGKRELLCCESGQWSGPEIIQKLSETQLRYSSRLIVENNGVQEWIGQFAGAAGFHTFPFTTGRNKAHPELGIEGLAIELARGDWIFPSNRTDAGYQCDPEVESLCGELLWYSPSEHTGDRLMAMWFAREGIRLTNVPDIPPVEVLRMNNLRR